MFGPRKPLTDEEYVERIRKSDRAFHRMRWLWPILFLCFLWCLFSIPRLIQSFIEDLLSAGKESVWLGFSFGLALGFIFCLLAAHSAMCIKQWLDARYGNRAQRLMVKYHDALKSKNALDSRGEPLP